MIETTMMDLAAGQAWPETPTMVRYRKPASWQVMCVLRLRSGRPVREQLQDAAQVYADETGHAARMGFVHRMPDGVGEFAETGGLCVTWAEWVPPGFAAVYCGGTEVWDASDRS